MRGGDTAAPRMVRPVSLGVTLAEWMPALVARWRQQRKGSGAPSPAEKRQIAEAVSRLSHGLTRERALAGERYLDEPALAAAYLLFWWPISLCDVDPRRAQPLQIHRQRTG